MADHNCIQGPRFDALEESISQVHGKLDKLVDLLISTARTDEQLKALRAEVDQMKETLKKCDDFRQTNAVYVKWAERILWLVIAAGLGILKLKGG